MLYNYVKIAIRTISKHRVFSFINIVGLSMAMSACMAIIMLVADQMELDRFNTQAASIFRVNTSPVFYENGHAYPGSEVATTTLPLRDELVDHYTGVEQAVRFVRGFGNFWLQIEPNYDVNIPVSGLFADPEVFQVFQYELEYGDSKTALIDPYSVVVTKATARKLFKQDNPIGETIKVGKLGNYTVTGVLKDNGNRSHIVADAFASIATIESLAKQGVLGNDLSNWQNFTAGWVYVKLKEGFTEIDLTNQLKQIESKHPNTNKENGSDVHYFTQGLLDIVPGHVNNNAIGPFMPWTIIYFLSAVAGIILVTSCFNFTNLSIARALTRAKEIGVRKTTGALRWQLFTQFLMESVLVAFFALALAILILYALKPLIEDLAFARFFHWNLTANVYVYVAFFLFALGTGILAGFFPAMVLSGLKPIAVLKNLQNTSLMSRVGLRKSLLVAQFALSTIFILTVLVLYNQLNLLLHNDNGFSVENKIVIQKGNANLTLLKNELSKQAGFTDITLTSHIPLTGVNYGENYRISDSQNDWKFLATYSADENYQQNMNLELVAGRFFTADEVNKSILVNEEAVKAFQLGNPAEALGKVIKRQHDSTEFVVIGVLKNYHHEMLSQKLQPMGLLFDTTRFTILQARFTGNFTQAKQQAAAIWTNLFPGTVVEVKSFQEELGIVHEIIFGTIFKVLGALTFFAVLISCLGLLGMATYTVETKRKEIAIRKVLGSSLFSLLVTLSKGYVILVLLAVVISVPAAYFINTLWLEQLTVHVTVDSYTILTGVLLLLALALLTIGSQTWQATRLNPVDNLKSE
ncbi:MAG: ABC transporter permease [Chryseotalea sp.]